MKFNDFETATITICDWQGKVVWISSEKKLEKIGHEAWRFIASSNREEFCNAFAEVIAKSERSSLTVAHQRGIANICMWPLESPEWAVCILTCFSPIEMKNLSQRELEYLPLLSQGYTVKELAAQLDVSLNTVHSQLRTMREKLSLADNHKLICFATRYSGFINLTMTNSDLA